MCEREKKNGAKMYPMHVNKRVDIPTLCILFLIRIIAAFDLDESHCLHIYMYIVRIAHLANCMAQIIVYFCIEGKWQALP